MVVTVVALATLQFGLHRFTDFGLSVMRPLRSGLFRVLFAALLLHALFAPAASWTAQLFRSRVMVALGKYSYGLYVYHHFLSSYFVRHGTEFPLARAVGSHTLAVVIQATVGMAASMAVAWISYELFEKRFLQLKRFWPSKKEATVLATAMNAP
jgi:peptidoglycan/LPS O-acetylase OafA/YrhL